MLNSKSPKPLVSTSARVMKICLMVSIAIGCLILVLAAVGGRGVFKLSAGVIPVVAIQWFFYLAVRAKRLNRIAPE